MESLINPPLADKTQKQDRKTQSQNKVSIGSSEFERLKAWLAQLEESSKGFLSLGKADLINFLIREHKAELSQKEIQKIKRHHYDPIRHLNWITPKLKEALSSNDNVRVHEIQEEIRGIELSVIHRAQEKTALSSSEQRKEAAKPGRAKLKKSSREIPIESATIKESTPLVTEI